MLFQSLSFYKSDWLHNNLDSIEFVILLILIVITIFRRKISSNHEYRNNSTKNDKSFRNPIVSTTASSIKKLNFKLAKEKIASSIKRFRNKHLKQYLSTINSVVGNTIDNDLITRNRNHDIDKFQIADFSIEIMINIVSYLKNFDIVNLKSISKPMHQLISNECLWEQLWIQTYGQMWLNPMIRKIREDRGIFWSPIASSSSSIVRGYNNSSNQILASASAPPTQGWYLFYLMFEVCWVDWILAGYCTQTCSLIGIDNSIFDVTKFISKHPGSLETITEGAGCDATDIFLEIGHSTHALELMKGMYVWNSHDIRKNNLSCVCGSQVCNSSLIRGNSNNSSSSSELCSFINERDRNRDKTISSMNRAGSSYMDTNNSSSCRKVIESTRNISLNTRLHVQMKINAQKISNLAYSRRFDLNENNSFPAPGTIERAGSFSSSLSSTEDSQHQNNHNYNNNISNSANIFENNIYNNTNKNCQPQLSAMKDFMNIKINKTHYKLRKLSYFGPTISMVPRLTDYYNCRTSQSRHFGQAKTYFDPLTLEFWVWWTCCGKGQLLIEPEQVLSADGTATVNNNNNNNNKYMSNSYINSAFNMFTFNYHVD